MQLAQRSIAQLATPRRRFDPGDPAEYTFPQVFAHPGQRYMMHPSWADDEGAPAVRVLEILYQRGPQLRGQLPRLIYRECGYPLGGGESRILVGHILPQSIVVVLKDA